jgi:hypothetical protein
MRKRHFAAAALGLLAVLSPVLRAANLPRPAPRFTVNLANGRQVTLSQYKGNVVALLFILTTCPHCQKAIGCLTEEQKEFGPRGFQTISSAIEDMAKMNVPDFVRRFDPPFPVGYNNFTAALDFLQHPAPVPALMPMVAFVDRQGVVRAQYEGSDPFFADDKMAANIHAKIKELMGPEAPSKTGVRKKTTPKK